MRLSNLHRTSRVASDGQIRSAAAFVAITFPAHRGSPVAKRVVRHLGTHLALVLVAVAGADRLPAQQAHTIHGRVISWSDSAPIADALVKPLDIPSTTVSSGSGGGFSLRLATATRLLAVRIGFAPETVSVTLGVDTLTIRLRPAPLTLDPIIVAAEPVYSAASSRAIREFDISLR